MWRVAPVRPAAVSLIFIHSWCGDRAATLSARLEDGDGPADGGGGGTRSRMRSMGRGWTVDEQGLDRVDRWKNMMKEGGGWWMSCGRTVDQGWIDDAMRWTNGSRMLNRGTGMADKRIV